MGGQTPSPNPTGATMSNDTTTIGPDQPDQRNRSAEDLIQEAMTLPGVKEAMDVFSASEATANYCRSLFQPYSAPVNPQLTTKSSTR